MLVNLDLPLWPRQKQALTSIANDQLFGGASEGGKSYYTRVVLSLAGLQCKGLQMTLIRKKFDDILTNHVEGNKGFRALLHPLTSAGVVDITEKRIRFPNGNVCNFKHCQDERQFDSAQGNENQIVAVDEAPQIKKRLIQAFRGWCRITPEHLAQQPIFWQKKLPYFLQTGNPTGDSVGYFRREYVKARAPFSIEEIGGFRRQYVPSRATDNLSVDLIAHTARLSMFDDEQLAKALDTGDWDAVVGDFFRTYNDDYHSVDNFIPPNHWFKFRTFDWGSDEPFSCLWWCVSDGQEFESIRFDEETSSYVTETLWFPRESLIAYREWHGCDPSNPEKGLGLTNREIAQGIKDRTTEPCHYGWATYTDGYPFADHGASKNDKKYKIKDEFEENGVPLTRANTGRVYGSNQVKARLKGKEGYPLIYFCACCKYARDYLPSVQRHPLHIEDYVEDGEATHSVDIIRYACTLKPLVIDKKPEVGSLIIQPPTSAPTVNMIIKKINQRNSTNQRARY